MARDRGDHDRHDVVIQMTDPERRRAILEEAREHLAATDHIPEAAERYRLEHPPLVPAPEPEPVGAPLPPTKQRAAPAPPVPDKIVIPAHDANGRVTSAMTFEGDGAAAARSWQDYIERRIEARIRGLVEPLGAAIGQGEAEAEERMGAQIEGLRAEIRKLRDAIERLERVDAEVRRLEGLQRPAAPH